MTKRELETKVKTLEKENQSLKVELLFLEDEYHKFSSYIGVLGFTIKEVYRCYPHILSECCTDKELIRVFKVQSELDLFIRKIKELKDKEGDSGLNEI